MLIETREASRVYQMGTNQVTALDRVSMGADEGEFVAIQGTSGSGKSTLLNLLGGLDRPTTGDVVFDAQALGPFTKKQMARYRRFSVGMIFQNFNLIPTMTADENVRLALWRMDSALAPLIAQESVQPYFAYGAFYPLDRAYTCMFGEVQKGELIAASPWQP